ncbi:hypothetical protein MNBD_NITROSPIRAE01-1620 [hydrothermal vent metagenome]|uniref:VOC domain-containing protein n=1 Tax=hydrothermal vent metagenome TaxID=652676 RepID=A0A3B1CEJ8_9ZZZZ
MNRSAGKTYWFDLPVTDLERAKSFYAGLLGWKFKKLMRSEVLNYWMIDSSGTLIGGLQRKRETKKEGEAPVIYFYVDQLENKIQEAQNLGATLEGEQIDLGLNRGYFQRLRDLDQNLIALWTQE